MQRAFLAFAWFGPTTKLLGVLSDVDGAREVFLNLPEKPDEGFIIGPVPMEHFIANGEVHKPAPVKSVWDAFRPSELVALYRECVRCAEDDEDTAKMLDISNAYANLTGDDIRDALADQ